MRELQWDRCPQVLPSEIPPTRCTRQPPPDARRGLCGKVATTRHPLWSRRPPGPTPKSAKPDRSSRPAGCLALPHESSGDAAGLPSIALGRKVLLSVGTLWGSDLVGALQRSTGGSLGSGHKSGWGVAQNSAPTLALRPRNQTKIRATGANFRKDFCLGHSGTPQTCFLTKNRACGTTNLSSERRFRCRFPGKPSLQTSARSQAAPQSTSRRHGPELTPRGCPMLSAPPQSTFHDSKATRWTECGVPTPSLHGPFSMVGMPPLPWPWHGKEITVHRRLSREGYTGNPPGVATYATEICPS